MILASIKLIPLIVNQEIKKENLLEIMEMV